MVWGMMNDAPGQPMFLMPNWDLGKPAAFDLTVAPPLNQSILNEVCVTAGSSAWVS